MAERILFFRLSLTDWGIYCSLRMTVNTVGYIIRINEAPAVQINPVVFAVNQRGLFFVRI